MGMVFYLRPASAQELGKVHESSDAAAEFLFGDLDADDEADPEGLVGLDKAWHAIHFLLTGQVEGGSWPRNFLLQGGREIKGTDNGYGPMRSLSPGEVKQVFAVLSTLPIVKLRDAFDPAKMDRAGIYPQIWKRDGEEGYEYIAGYYEVLRRAFADATAKGMGVVLCIS